MSKLPGYTRLNKQDYKPESQDLISQLADSLNYSIEVLFDSLNGKLTFADNMDSTIKTFNIEADSTGKPLATTSFKKVSSNRISGLSIIRVDNLTNPSVFPTSGVTASFTETTDTITINHITGLPVKNIFQITVVTIR